MLLELLAFSSLGLATPADLTAIAAASPRPATCLRLQTQDRRLTIWKRAINPKLAPYCHLISKAHARLRSDPKQARALADEAESLLPGRAAPLILKARAALRQGQLKLARKHFEQAIAIDPRSIEPPVIMHDLARVKWRSGKLNEALTLYRTLAPRVALLPKAALSQQVLLEAAHLSMAMARKQAKPAASLTEALALLQQAQRHQELLYRRDLALSLALVLDRAGQWARADAVLASVPQLSRWLREASASYVAHPIERQALRAMATQNSAPHEAIAHWTRFLDSSKPGDPWRPAAQDRRARLLKQHGRSKKKP